MALRITEETVEVDNCYNSETGSFQPGRIIALKEEPTLQRIYDIPTKDLQEYEREIDQTNCDYLIPIVFEIKEGGTETRVEWKGVQNCYPETMKKQVQEIQEIFDKYK